MARLAAVEKALYYPTDEPVVRLIAKVVRPPPGATRILDPCAGEGAAVALLARAWRLEPFGVELDEGRAHAARAAGVRCVHGGMHGLTATDGAFGVLFENPPYDHGVDDDGNSLRQEVQFLRDSARWLAPGGLLVFVPPEPILDDHHFADVMRRHFRDITSFRFPSPFYERFRQCVVLARKADGAMYHYGIYERSKDLPILSEDQRYASGLGGREAALDAFDIIDESPEEFAPRADDAPSGCYALPRWRTLVGAGARYDLRPLLPLRTGHRALLLAAGCLDGSELRPGLLVKGSSEKIVTERVDDDAEKKYETERIVSRISTLDLISGELATLRVDEEPERAATWFEENAAELARAVAEAYPPAFHGDLARFDFSGLRAPGVLPGRCEPEILPVQKTTAAAVAWWWRNGHKAAAVSGEMGTGKTTMGACAVELAGARKVVVMCPGHLVSKWIREAAAITGGRAVTARKLADVDRFFADPALRFLVVSKDSAKLGARWRGAFLRKRVRITREVPIWEESRGMFGARRQVGTETVKSWANVIACPRCGATQMAGELHVSAETFTKQKVRCSEKRCREPLWQAVPISERGTKRWAIAKYINQRYARRFVLILDECHQYAGADTDQSRAAQHLAAASAHVLAMTGTLYGGRATGIFHLLYKVDPEFRKLYRFNAAQEFAQHHGLFETVTDLRESTSVYGHRRGNAGGRVREIPGASPSMIKLLLNYTAFVRLPDLGVELPPYTEEVEVIEPDPDVLAAAQAMARQCEGILRKHPRVLGQYLQACLGYPDRPDQAEEIQERNDVGDPIGQVLASAPALDRPCMKDARVVELVREEREAGRGVLIYFTQTTRRDARGRVRSALEAAGFKVAVLDGAIAPGKREEWVARAIDGGAEVMLTNGALVETGLDLLWAHTIIQYGLEYSVHRLRQSTRRSWRLGQSKPVKVIYMVYRGTAQEPALKLVAKKQRAAELLDGEEAGGLAQHDTEGHDFFIELAREIVEARTLSVSMPETLGGILIPRERQFALPLSRA